ncbi:hypothetical protein [Catellatospora sp. NPDC049133]|uniref:hypothetical protein n=1 Tax=Catellatospora sp. NPDC049133 TaxID=3155499 RepID=UPI003407F57E
MVDPVTVGLVGVASAVVLKAADAGAELLVLRGRVALVDAVSRLPRGSEIQGVGKDGVRWEVRVGTGPSAPELAA